MNKNFTLEELLENGVVMLQNRWTIDTESKWPFVIWKSPRGDKYETLSSANVPPEDAVMDAQSNRDYSCTERRK